MRCHLRSIGVLVNLQISACYYGKEVVTNTITTGSIINKKYLALAFHFCRENLPSEEIGIMWAEVKHKIVDAIEKSLRTTEFHTHVSRVASKS